MSNKKDSRLEITELFLANPYGDFSHCYYGTIKRGQDSVGNPKVWGKIDVDGTTVLASAKDQRELGNQLDQMVLAVLKGYTKANRPVGGVNMN